MSLDVALSLVNKLHSYLVHNISAAAILPSEFVGCAKSGQTSGLK